VWRIKIQQQDDNRNLSAWRKISNEKAIHLSHYFTFRQLHLFCLVPVNSVYLISSYFIVILSRNDYHSTTYFQILAFPWLIMTTCVFVSLQNNSKTKDGNAKWLPYRCVRNVDDKDKFHDAETKQCCFVDKCY